MRKATILLAGLLLAGAVSGCASRRSDDPTVATGGGSKPTATASFDGAAYTKCMRSNGMDWFPDVTGGNTNVDVPDGTDRTKFNAAVQACRKYVPGDTGQASPVDAGVHATLLKYAQCMRSNGVPDFPDPAADATGPGIDKSSGIDITSKSFKAAEQACRTILPNDGS